MSGAAKMRLIELTLRDGSKKQTFLVTPDKAKAIATLVSTPPSAGGEFHAASDVFPDLKDPSKRPAITFRGIRAKTGLTQEELGERLGISQADVSKIERGHRAIGKALAKRIEKEFKMDYRRFL